MFRALDRAKSIGLALAPASYAFIREVGRKLVEFWKAYQEARKIALVLPPSRRQGSSHVAWSSGWLEDLRVVTLANAVFATDSQIPVL